MCKLEELKHFKIFTDVYSNCLQEFNLNYLNQIITKLKLVEQKLSMATSILHS